MNSFWTIAIIGASFIVASCSDVKMSETDARKYALEAITSYCRDEKLPLDSFRLKAIGPSGNSPWVLVYVSSGMTPPQEVVIDIDQKGNLSLARKIGASGD